jgi:hypothetical protein
VKTAGWAPTGTTIGKENLSRPVPESVALLVCFKGCQSELGAFVLRIERSANGRVVFTLSGRMQTDDIEQVQQLLIVETPGQQLTFDLRDVTLVNQDVVTFLADCEAKGITHESCPLHIRNWINQVKRRNKRRQRQKRDT